MLGRTLEDALAIAGGVRRALERRGTAGGGAGEGDLILVCISLLRLRDRPSSAGLRGRRGCWGWRWRWRWRGGWRRRAEDATARANDASSLPGCWTCSAKEKCDLEARLDFQKGIDMNLHAAASCLARRTDGQTLASLNVDQRARTRSALAVSWARAGACHGAVQAGGGRMDM